MEKRTQTAKVKMSGYLHLKIKKRMMTSWKNYWFVLEDRLLLYYRSKAEYEAISPCKGSINLGPPCAVKSLPSVNNAFQIETRTMAYTLKAENSDEQKKWLQVMLSALNQNQNFNPDGAKRLSHFRYSLDDLIPEVEPNDNQVFQKINLERQYTMPNRLKSPTKDKENNEIIQRLQKMGAHSYGGSLEAISKIATKKVSSSTIPECSSGSKGSLPEEVLREEEEIVRKKRVCGNNIYERISGDSEDSNRGSFLVDNENYSVPMRKSLSAIEDETSDKNTVTKPRETKSLLVENDQYGLNRPVQSEEVIYAEPKINEQTDCNKNSVVVENSFYASANVISQNENLYEDLDKFNYSQSTEENSSQSSVDCNKMSKDTKKPNEKQLKKSKSFIKRVWKKRKHKKEQKEEKAEDEEIYAEIDATAVEKVSVSDGSAIQMLSELQNILEKQKSKMKVSKTSIPIESKTNEKKPPIPSTPPVNSDVRCPKVPPKAHKISQETVSKQPIEQMRSLDEILEDLDKEKMESKGKVQMLIEKFSESEEDVVLRRHDKPDFKVYRHSDELNKLLNELAKVTSAPIMTPGVTSSLVNPNLTDEEWLKLLPVRQRRLSEPDYDVPRLHKSIQLPIEPNAENSDAIPATRFFGPVLSHDITNNKEESLPISMAPDSLEVLDAQKCDIQYSYTSHNYIDNQPVFQRFSPKFIQDDKVIYALPKSYVSVATHIVNTCQNICGAPMTDDECTIVYKTVKNVEMQEEIFNDSLEACNEVSTEF